MKIRFGFVSNSSTSSFLMYGVRISDRPDLLDVFDSVYDELAELNIDVVNLGGECYIGRSLAEIADEQTFREFKEETRKIVKRFLAKYKFDAKDGEFAVYEESWGDY